MKNLKQKFVHKKKGRKKMTVTGNFDKESPYGTKYCSIIQLVTWLNEANVGDEFIYAEGPSIYSCEIAEVVRKLTMEGEILPLQKRQDGKNFYLARKRNRAVPFKKPWIFGEN